MKPLPRIFILALLLPATAPAATPSAWEKDPSGWEDLLENLENWERVPPSPNPKYALARVSPWKIDPKTGILQSHCENVYEMYLHRTSRTNGIVHVEWRYIGTPPKPDAGLLVRANDDASIWLQAQIATPGLGTMSNKVPPQHRDKKVSGIGQRRPDLLKPAGEWNAMEVTCQTDTISLWFNGEKLSEIKNYGFPSGRIGLQAEYAPIEFRRVLFKPLP